MSSTDLHDIKPNSSTMDAEKALSLPSSDASIAEDTSFPSEEVLLSRTNALAEELAINQKKLMWKIDICVVPPFVILYFLAFLDRINISNAKVYGIEDDIGLTGNQFNTALTLFFVPYVFFEVASNYCMKRTSPHLWLSMCIFIFGAVTVGMGFVKNFGGLAACRFLLGTLEAACFPGIFYVLSTFYTPAESQRRFSAFFSCVCLAGASGSALAYRIHDLDGVRGHASWQWIFIIEGAFTMGLGVILFFILPDFPETSKFLTDKEKEFIKRKLEINTVSSGYEEKIGWRDLWDSFIHEPLYILNAFPYFCLLLPSYGYAYFLPTIVKQLGYTAEAANQHSVYPWLLAFFFSNAVAFASDFTKIRLPYAIMSSVLSVLGLALVVGLPDNANGRYAGCFIAAAGLYTAAPQLVCLTSLNFGGHARKSLGTAFQVGFGNIGGIIAPFLFLSKDSPTYTSGMAVSIAFAALSGIAFVVLWGVLIMKNKKKQTQEYKDKFFAQSHRQIVLQGDLHPSFRYMY